MAFFRGASPYIEGHRGRTFVVVIPGEVVSDKPLLYPLLEDVALLHGNRLWRATVEYLMVVIGTSNAENTFVSLHRFAHPPKSFGSLLLIQGLRITV